MIAFLNKFNNSIRFFAVCVVAAIVTYTLLMTVKIVYAANYSGKVSGYAFGSTSASGTTLQQYHFANHPPGICNDPAANWAWGTQITMANAVQQRRVDNVPYTRKVFYLYDNGDPSCSQGNYWADIYFGRFKQNPTQNCTCSGVNAPSCVSGTNNVNNCTDAIGFGNTVRNYSQP